MNTQDTNSDSVKNYGTILLIATIASNLSNYVYHVFMSRSLGPVEYGEFQSLLAIFMIVAIPVSAIQMVAARFTSRFLALQDPGQIPRILKVILKGLFYVGGGGLICYLYLSGRIAEYLKISSIIPVIIVGVALLLTLFVPVGLGILQGAQRFPILALGIFGPTLSRLVSGIVLVVLGYGVNGAVGASAVAAFIGILIAFLPLRPVFKNKPQKMVNIGKEVAQYSMPVMSALLLFSLMTYIDMVLVKHYFTPQEAGYYGAASLVGKAFLFIPMAFIMVMFPQTAHQHTIQEDAYPLLKRTLAMGMFFCIAGVICCFFLAHYLVLFLFGKEYLSIVPLIKYFGLAISPLAMVNVFINFNLARQRYFFLIPLVIFTAVEIIFIQIFHERLGEILWILGGCGCGLFAVYYGLIAREQHILQESLEPEREEV